MRIILHLGMPKTGTTFLQKQLFDLYQAPKSDTLYPQIEAGQESQNRLIKDLLPVEGTVRLYKKHPAETFLTERYFDRLVASVKSCKTCKNVIISGELMHLNSSLLIDKLREYFPKNEIDVIVYFRFPVSDFLASSYQQLVKASSILPSMRKMKQQVGDAERTYEECKLLESRKNIKFIPRIYNREVFLGGNILTDFLLSGELPIALEEDAVNKKSEEVSVNSSLSAEGTYLFRSFREYCIGKEGDNVFDSRSKKLLQILQNAEQQLRNAQLDHNFVLTKLKFRPEVLPYIESLSLPLLEKLYNSSYFDPAVSRWLQALLNKTKACLVDADDQPNAKTFDDFFDFNSSSLEYLSSKVIDALIESSCV